VRPTTAILTSVGNYRIDGRIQQTLKELMPNALPTWSGSYALLDSSGKYVNENDYEGFDLRDNKLGLLYQSKKRQGLFVYETAQGADLLYIRRESTGYGIFTPSGSRLATCASNSSETVCR
jgi:hypothetical protein